MKEGPRKQTGFFPAKFVMKIEETEKPFLVTKQCFGNSRRKELKAKENTVRHGFKVSASNLFQIVVVNYAQSIQREDCLLVRSLEGEGFVPKDVLKAIWRKFLQSDVGTSSFGNYHCSILLYKPKSSTINRYSTIGRKTAILGNPYILSK